MHIEELMTMPVFTCHPTDSLRAAAQLMWDHDCGVIPVVDADDRLVGMITDRDICMAAFTQGKPLEALGVEGAMARQVFSVGPDQTIGDAENLMAEKQVRRLPVVDAAGKPVGIVSLNDLARAADRSGRLKDGLAKVLHTLAEICQPREHTREAA